ncbi:OLC1v1036599C1 [Oldenlandia corymbosa var. corymbosa]|uniref:OLC1v1036599C1 n=1 Tax=Oldenlandia corymbosa var. corymbosa TaxID=529605 RepID=A0AAV1CYZ9_OLDCO|nr:OLC1v1036599C1 [Oldenlandia corymbosa var. corymbosa]
MADGEKETSATIRLINKGFVHWICADQLQVSFACQSDELLVDDKEFDLEGCSAPRLTLDVGFSVPSSPSQPIKKRSSEVGSGSESDSKIQFSLEHAFGDSGFSPGG